MTAEDIENAKELANKELEFFLYSNNVDSEHFEFMLRKENCLTDGIIPMCFYVIGVYANNINQLASDTKFTLMTSFSKEHL